MPKKGKSPFSGHDAADFELLFTYYELKKKGKSVTEPEDDRPTEQDYIAALTDAAKGKKVLKTVEAWRAYDSVQKLHAQTRKKIDEAIKNIG